MNRSVRRLYADTRRRRLDGARAGHEIQSNKPQSSDLAGAFKGLRSIKSPLEIYLESRLGADETPFDPRVREHVKKEFLEFYRRYATAQAGGWRGTLRARRKLVRLR